MYIITKQILNLCIIWQTILIVAFGSVNKLVIKKKKLFGLMTWASEIIYLKENKNQSSE